MCKQLDGTIFLPTFDNETLYKAMEILENKNIFDLDTVDTLEIGDLQGDIKDIVQNLAKKYNFNSCIAFDSEESKVVVYISKVGQTIEVPAKDYLDGLHKLNDFFNSSVCN